MAIAVGRIANAFNFLSGQGCTLGRLTVLFSSLQHMSDNSSGSFGLRAIGHEFAKWHNGGGLSHRTAQVDPTVLIENGAVVHQNSVLGMDVHIGSGAIVGPSVSIGNSTKVGYNAVLSNCSVGVSCIIHSGVCVGQDGFGFFVDEGGHVVKKPQELHVRIGNHVEIGANTCIDRGR